MKVKELTKDDVFTPFTVQITFENEDEARLMWHVFNRGKLWDAICTNNYGGGYYKTPAAEFNSELAEIIGKHVGLYQS